MLTVSNRPSWSRARAIGLLVVVTACSSSKFDIKPREFSYQNEAGSSHVAVLSVARWEDYAGALQPKFALTEKEALERVVPSTRGLQEQIVDALRVLVKLAPPQSITQTTEGIKVTERQPGDVSAVPDVASAAGERTAAGTPVSDAALKTSLGVDPLLQHVAATALFQEVQLLNRYVRDAAARSCFAPYVVRLQLAQLPSARNEPYDEYVSIGFFNRLEGPDTSAPPKRSAVSARPDCLLSGRCDHDARIQRMPLVVPLLVTDNLEATTHAKSVDEVKQFSLALLLMIKGFGASGSVDKFDEELQSILGRDYNSLLTVTRMTDNTLRVRLGAAQQVGSNYAMVPRTHNITTLLLVPCPPLDQSNDPERRKIKIATHAELVHAETGKALQSRPKRALRADLEAIRQRFALAPVATISKENATGWVRYIAGRTDCEDFTAALGAYGWSGCARCSADRSDPDAERTIDACQAWTPAPLKIYATTYLERLYPLVPQANYVAFNAGLDLLGIPRGKATFLWSALADLTIGNDYNSASFELPELVPPEWFSPQTAVVVDDKKSRSTVLLRGSRGLQPDLLSASLHAAGRTFPAEAIAALANGRDFRLTFPSLADLGIKHPADLFIEVDFDNRAVSCPQLEMCDSRWTSRGGQYVAKEGGPDPEQPAATLKAGAQIIRATKEGTGQVDVTVSVEPGGTAKSVKLTVTGATVESVAQAGQPTVTNPGVEFSVQVGSLVLGLRNLSPDRAVTVTAKNGRAPLSFPVMADSSK